MRTLTPNKTLSRRGFVMASGSAVMITSLPNAALALTEAGATSLVNALVGDINKVIASGKSENAMIREFERIFGRYADVPIMARYALGADGRQASQAQLRGFTNAFQGYIARKYGKRFREFIGAKIEVKSARKIKSGYEIKSTAFLRGESPFEVTFLVSDRSGRDLFFNMFIEGVNMLLTERTEIGALLDQRRGNLDQLIADLPRLG